MCDIVLLVYDQLDYTRGCIESIIKNTDYPYRLIIVDNGSVLVSTRDYLSEISNLYPDRVVILRNPVNQGYVKAVNLGIAATDREFVCVISNDTVVYPGWLSEMIRVAKLNPEIGLVNPEWEIPGKFGSDRERYFKSVISKRKGRFIETGWTRGFCFLVKRPVIDKIGVLDLAFAPAYYDDWDYSVRAIKAGFTCFLAQGAFVWHYKNVTYNLEYDRTKMAEVLEEKGRVFTEKWGKPLRLALILGDELNGFTQELEGFSLALLRSQNKLELIKSDPFFNIKHTSCFVRDYPGFFLKAAASFWLLNNLRHNKLKRFAAVLCSPEAAAAFEKLAFIRDNYRIMKIERDISNLSGLLETLERSKKTG
jgi:GT2 family glycosyltransferase